MSGPGTGLTAFLAARLDEDEAAAKAATDGPWYADGSQIRGHSRAYAGADPGILVVKHTWPQDSTHITRHDPPRVLRDVAAKREALDLYSRTLALVESPPPVPASTPMPEADRLRAEQRHGPGARMVSALDYLNAKRELAVLGPVVRQFAAIYSDHPDYRQEWAA